VHNRGIKVRNRTFKVHNRIFKVRNRIFAVRNRGIKVHNRTFRVHNRTFKVRNRIFKIHDRMGMIKRGMIVIRNKIVDEVMRRKVGEMGMKNRRFRSLGVLVVGCSIKVGEDGRRIFFDCSGCGLSSHQMTWSHRMTVAIYFAPKGA